MIAQVSRMGEIYDFRGYRVSIVQQWRDPLGRPMVRVATVDAAAEIAEGMLEADFLGLARRFCASDDRA